MENANKEIDAVAMTRRIRDGHYEALEEKSSEERIAFYRKKSHAFREKVNRARPDTRLE